MKAINPCRTRAFPLVRKRTIKACALFVPTLLITGFLSLDASAQSRFGTAPATPADILGTPCMENECWAVLDGSRTSVIAADASGGYDVATDCDVSPEAALMDDNVSTCCRWNINDVTNVSLTIDPRYLTTWTMGRVVGAWDWPIGNDGPQTVRADMVDVQDNTQSAVGLTINAVQFRSDPDYLDGVTWTGTELRLDLRSTTNVDWEVCDLTILYDDVDGILLINGFE